MAIPSSGFWEDMVPLYQWGVGSLENLHGQHACFHLQLTPRVAKVDNFCLIVATVEQALQLDFASSNRCRVPEGVVQEGPTKVLIRATLQDYEAILRHTDTVRLIQAYVRCEDGFVVLDATTAPSFFAGCISLRADECVEVAEIFAGGFAGWHRATSVLYHAGLKVHTSWCLEKDSACAAPLLAGDATLSIVETLQEVDFCRHPDDSLLIMDDFSSEWWRPIIARRPVDIMCISPPCQPWSRAARQAGLNSADGRLILQAVDYLKATGVKIAIFEEVEQFPRHKHFGIYFAAIEAAGFRCAWRGSLQLAEVAPSFRARYFLIWIHGSAGPHDVQIVATAWQAVKKPTLRNMDALFTVLPTPLLQPCQLSAEVLSMYLDPMFLPVGRLGCRPSTSAYSQRVLTADQQVGCIMAQYHAQHELPHDLLCEKGILGQLVEVHSTVRFLAAPEIASIHGACSHMLLPSDDRTSMRTLGNALACQQSTFVLALALQATPLALGDPAEYVQCCIKRRMTASNCLLLEVRDGWLMCHHDNIGAVLSRSALRSQIMPRLQVPGDCFQTVKIASGQGSKTVHLLCRVSIHFRLQDVLARLALEDAQIMPGSHEGAMCVDVPCPLKLSLVQHCKAQAGADCCLHVIACGVHFFLHRQMPDIFIQLRQAFAQVPGHARANVKCYDLAGNRCHHFDDMLATVLAVPCVDGLLQEAPLGQVQTWAAGRALPHICALTIEVPGTHAEDWWLAFPVHFAEALGFVVEYSAFPPPAGTPWLVNLHAGGSNTPYDVHEARRWLRVLLFLAPARFAASTCLQAGSSIAARSVELQVVGATVWKGCLPVTTDPATVEAWWAAASVCVGLDPACRLYSGPYPMAPQQTIRDVPPCTGPGQVVRRHTGNLLLTLMPAVYGGGAKKEKQSSAESQVAQLCLENGFSLDDATRTTAQLVKQVGHHQVNKALEAPSPALQWEQIQRIAQASGIKPPSESDIAARVTRRVNAQAKRRQQFASVPRTADFMLAGNFFLNQDGTEATILRSLAPRSSGVILI